MIDAFVETKVAQIVGTKFIAQVAGKLFVLFEKSVLPVGAEDVMAMFDLIENGGQLAAQPLMKPDAEDFTDAVGGEAPQADLAAALEDLVDGKVTLEDEVATVLNLADGVEAGQVHLVPFFLGELGAQQEGPVIELLANDLWAQPVRGGLQVGHIVDGEKGVVALVEADARSIQFLLDEGMAVEPVGGVKGKEGGYAQHDRSENLIPDIKIVVGEAAALVSQDAVVGVWGGIFGNSDAKGPTLFHALEDEIDPVGILLDQTMQLGGYVLFFAHSLFRPLDGDVMVAGIGLRPVPVIFGALAEHFFVHHREAQNLTDEIHHLLGSRQTA